MSDIFIVSYCHENCTPLQSITRLPEDEAYAKARELAAANEGTAFGRFSDFHNYYPRRIRTEEWLHEQFLLLGGQPASAHPLYFVLQGSDYLNRWFGEGRVTRLPIQAIRSEHISFTFGDSMAKMDTPERKAPFTKEMLYAFVDDHGQSVDAFLDSIKGQYTYIEAQLWDDGYLSPP